MQEVIVTKIKKEDVNETSIGFAVIGVKHNGKWVFVRHKERTTLEICGGHREAGETPLEAAHRELFEETGAKIYTLFEVCTYKVTIDGEASYGQLFFADVDEFGTLPENFEIAERVYSEKLPNDLTYPQIQPHLFSYLQGWLTDEDLRS